MKKHIFFTLAIILSVSLFYTKVSADTGAYSGLADFSVADEYKNFVTSLDETIKDVLPEDFGISAEDDAAKLTSWNFLLYSLGDSFALSVKSILPSFARLIGVILLIALIKRLSELTDAKSASLISFISSICIAASFILMQYDTVLLVKERLNDISSLAACMAPVFAALYTAGGNVNGAYVSGGGLGIFIFITEQILSNICFPFFGAAFCLASISASGELKLNGVLRSLKKAYTNILSFTMSIFCAILAAQSIIGAGRDSLSLRAAKFITSSSLPIVGSAVGESLKSLGNGIGMLRKSVGGVGVVMVLLLILPTTVLLILNGTLLNFSASLAEILGCDKEKELLENISGIYTCLTATLTVCAVTFAFMLIMLARSAVAVKA